MITTTDPALVAVRLASYRPITSARCHPAAVYGNTVGRVAMGKCDHCRTGFAWKQGRGRLRETLCPVCDRHLKATSSELIRYDWVALDVPA